MASYFVYSFDLLNLLSTCIKFLGKVQFEIHSEGGDDPGVKGEASIIVNGIECCPRKKGHNVVVLDEIGNVVATRSFNTVEPSEGMAMAKFLDEIPEQHIALIAVQDTTGKNAIQSFTFEFLLLFSTLSVHASFHVIIKRRFFAHTFLSGD